MHIVVCMKQVPRDNSVKINADLSVNADGIEKIINLFDEYAIEEGIAWNEQHGGKLTVLSLGSDEWVGVDDISVTASSLPPGRRCSCSCRSIRCSSASRR